MLIPIGNTYIYWFAYGLNSRPINLRINETTDDSAYHEDNKVTLKITKTINTEVRGAGGMANLEGEPAVRLFTTSPPLRYVRVVFA